MKNAVTIGVFGVIATALTGAASAAGCNVNFTTEQWMAIGLGFVTSIAGGIYHLHQPPPGGQS